LAITVSYFVAAALKILSEIGIISSNIEGHSASHFAFVDDNYPDMPICHSAQNEEQVRGALGKRMGNNLEFAGKVALITGGNSGIGAAAARRVAELGAQVVVTGRRQSEGRLLVNDIKRNSGSAAFMQADLSQPEQVKRIVPFTLKTFGRLDYAFNNAGISGENRLLTDQTEKTFDRVFAVNVKALFLLLQDEVKQMMAQGQGGSIVNTASVGGLLGFPSAGPYVASKHAVLGLTKTAAIECGRYGIRVNAVSPGAVRTEMLLDVFGTHGHSTKWARCIPLAGSDARRRSPMQLHGCFRTDPPITRDSP
jgi:NAD(P)-dependent dehydrogenase (short-subunit alcohol dehydrogenase family)